MTDTFEFTLDEESEKKLFEIMTEFNTEKIPSFTITDKYGNTAEYVKVTRCMDCKHYKDNECTNTFWGMYKSDYCSEGDRKESNTHER